MPIDWDAAMAEAEQQERDAAEQRRQAERARRAAYLADRERIEREQPEAVEIALRLLNYKAQHLHQQIKGAAERADLEMLSLWEKTAHFSRSSEKL